MKDSLKDWKFFMMSKSRDKIMNKEFKPIEAKYFHKKEVNAILLLVLRTKVK